MAGTSLRGRLTRSITGIRSSSPTGGVWRSALAAASIAALPLVFWLTPSWHHQLMTSAMYYYAGNHSTVGASGLERRLALQHELLYYRDGLTATVTVSRDLRSKDRDLYISTNGKIDGSSHYDMPNQRLAAHIEK